MDNKDKIEEKELQGKQELDRYVYIHGDRERGAEVIIELEARGGINKNKLLGNSEDTIYYLDNESIICSSGNLHSLELIKTLFKEAKFSKTKEQSCPPFNKNACICIYGVLNRGDEVINLLETFGGINRNRLLGHQSNTLYYIDKYNVIACTSLPIEQVYLKNVLNILELPKVEESHSFKPFDKILADVNGVWLCDLFSHKIAGTSDYSTISSSKVGNILPFEGNENLVGRNSQLRNK